MLSPGRHARKRPEPSRYPARTVVLRLEVVFRPVDWLKVNSVPPGVINCPVLTLNGRLTEPAGRSKQDWMHPECRKSRPASKVTDRWHRNSDCRRETPNRKPPVLSRVSTLPLISFASERLTSANRTLRFTCIGCRGFQATDDTCIDFLRMASAFIFVFANIGFEQGFPPLPHHPGSATVPVSKTKLLVVN